MPQGTAGPSQEDVAKQKAAEAEAEWQALVAEATEGDTAGSRQVERAITLEREMSAARKRVNDNREFLRLMARNDELNEAQVEFVETFYPEKEKGERRAQEDIDATRRAREAARKGK